MVGFRVFDVGLLILWLVWFFRLRDDEDDGTDDGGPGGGGPGPKRDDGPKGVKTQIQGEEIRVSSKKRDDLQAVIAMLKKADLDVALQFVNYR